MNENVIYRQAYRSVGQVNKVDGLHDCMEFGPFLLSFISASRVGVKSDPNCVLRQRDFGVEYLRQSTLSMDQSIATECDRLMSFPKNLCDARMIIVWYTRVLELD